MPRSAASRSAAPRGTGRHRRSLDTDAAPLPWREGRKGSARRTGRPQREVWGDVYVSADAALAQARERGISPREELARLFLHGCLHLLGHRDETPCARARMERVQEALLAALLGRRAVPRA